MHLIAKASLALATAYLLSASPALHAAEVTIALTGEVTQRLGNDPIVNSQIGIGAVVTGYYVFDTDTLDGNPSTMQGTYRHTVPGNGLFLEINGLEFNTNPSAVDFTVGVNDWGPGRGDTATLYSLLNVYSPGIAAASSSMRMAMTASDSGTLLSDALTPAALLAPGWFATSWSQPRINIYGAGGGTKFEVVARVLSVQLVETP